MLTENRPIVAVKFHMFTTRCFLPDVLEIWFKTTYKMFSRDRSSLETVTLSCIV